MPAFDGTLPIRSRKSRLTERPLGDNGPCTLRPIYFFIFPTKTEKGHITYPYHICIFQSTEKKEKKENGQENRSFFHFSNFEVKFKNTKNTVNG